jgi:prepilin peptidase CpaA
MVSTALLVGLLLVTTFTDIRWHKIYNWTTYPGMLAGLALSGIATLFGVKNGTESQVATFDIIPFSDSLLGLFSCGAMMLVCYVFFPGGVGGGDVKLIAMIGAFLGVMNGLEAMLWTFVLAGCMALIALVWRYGFVKLVTRSAKVTLITLRLGGRFRLTEEEREPLKTKLFLSPSALLAVMVVRFQLVERFL